MFKIPSLIPCIIHQKKPRKENHKNHGIASTTKPRKSHRCYLNQLKDSLNSSLKDVQDPILYPLPTPQSITHDEKNLVRTRTVEPSGGKD